MKIITHLVIRIIAYFAIVCLALFADSNGIISELKGLLIFPVLFFLFEIIFLQIRHKSVNLFAIFRTMGVKKMLKGILTIAVSLVVFFGLGVLTFLIIWHSSEDPRMRGHRYWSQFKTINVHNNTDKPVNVIINFRYTEEELAAYSLTIDNDYLNRIDTFLLGNSQHQFNFQKMHLPINEFDSIPFPKDFKISILDSTCTSVLRELDFDEFIAVTRNECAITNNNPLTQARWSLHIDSIMNSKTPEYDKNGGDE